MTPALSVLIPAHNEAAFISDCLTALFASKPLPQAAPIEVLVLANGCSDNTAAIAAQHMVPAGWHLRVIEIKDGGKLNALNLGEAEAKGQTLLYLDADVIVAPELLGQIHAALNTPEPRYASGSATLAPAQSLVTRHYGRFWIRLPFFQSGAPGFGLFAMNRAGRSRWEAWPDIIADDMLARLSFAPAERIRVSGRYHWPMVEGLRNLVRVRRRQDQGVSELAERFPELLQNEDKPPMRPGQLIRLFFQDPLGFGVYALVSLAVRMPIFRSAQRWSRGR